MAVAMAMALLLLLAQVLVELVLLVRGAVGLGLLLLLLLLMLPELELALLLARVLPLSAAVHRVEIERQSKPMSSCCKIGLGSDVIRSQVHLRRHLSNACGRRVLMLNSMTWKVHSGCRLCRTVNFPQDETPVPFPRCLPRYLRQQCQQQFQTSPLQSLLQLK